MADRRIESALERALELGEVGVQVAAYVGEELVVDEWIGVADEASGTPVDGSTLFPIFSVTKAITATALHLQVERGLVDLDEPIASYWPEYAASGKERITVRHVLMHRAGVPQMPSDLGPDALHDWDAIVTWLAAVEPLAPPGARSMYHSLSFGYLVGEVVRRTDPLHRSFGDFVRQELCEPFGAKDFWIGLPPDQEERVATLTWGASPPEAPQITPNPIRNASMPAALTPSPGPWNLPAVHQACIPAASGITTARDGARLFALLANGGELDGKRVLSEERLRALTIPRPDPYEVDAALGMPTWLGTGGYWIGGESPPADPVVGPGQHILAHGGAGGSIGWADLDMRLAALITHNRMFGAVPRDQHPFVALADAVRAVALG